MKLQIKDGFKCKIKPYDRKDGLDGVVSSNANCVTPKGSDSQHWKRRKHA